MKMIRTLIPILCLLCFLSPVYATEQEPLVIESYANAQKYTFTVSKSQLEKCPDWNDGGDVPFPVGKARTLGFKELHKLLPDADDYDFDTISLERQKSTGKWYYRIQFLKLRGIPPGPVPAFMVVVLFDGTVVDPVVGPMM